MGTLARTQTDSCFPNLCMGLVFESLSGTGLGLRGCYASLCGGRVTRGLVGLLASPIACVSPPWGKDCFGWDDPQRRLALALASASALLT